MFVIVVYDIKEERVNKVYKITRKYLYHRQRSVFDGNIDKSVLNELIEKLKKTINKEEDTVLIYCNKNSVDELIQLGVKIVDEYENIII